MISGHTERAEPARAHVFAIALLVLATCIAAASAAHAAPVTETRNLKQLAAASAALPTAPRLNEEDFSRRSRLREVKLSPDGAWVAFIENEGQAAHLTLLDARTQEKKRIATLQGRQELHWSHDGKVIFVDTGDGLSALTLADGSSIKIASFDRKLGQQLYAVDPSRPRAALVEEDDRAGGIYKLARVGADGKLEPLYEGKAKLHDFLLDGSGQLNFIRTLDTHYSQVVSRKVDGKWQEVARCKRLRACGLVSASADGRRLQMLVNHNEDRKTLVELDVARQTRKVLHTDPDKISDLRTVVLSPETQQPMFALYDMPQRRIYGLTAEAKRGAGDIAKRFPDAAISIGATESAPRWLLTERGARLQQERYWLYDRAGRGFTEILAQERQMGNPLPEAQLARKIALHYRASDGALVHGYLSLPPGKDASKVPMLTMVHGGPWGAFDSGYSSLVQLLVNRGVAVFMPNFRASTGYGDKYMLAPKADYGNGRAQADIIDGVRWLAANGIGDKDKLAIMGDSFGGYSTLLALTNTPDLFQFGMATVPPSDFVRTMKLASDAGGAMGGPEVPFSLTLSEMGIHLNDAAAMKQISADAPAVNAAKVRKPLMILAGAKDDKVEIAGVTAYVAALQGLDKPVGLLVDPDEGHNPRKPIVKQAYTYLLQRMIHKHLGGAEAPAPSPELARYLEQHMKASGAF